MCPISTDQAFYGRSEGPGSLASSTPPSGHLALMLLLQSALVPVPRPGNSRVHGVNILCFSFLMTSDPGWLLSLSAALMVRLASILTLCFLELLLTLLRCLEHSSAMAPGASFPSPGPHVPSCRQAQVVPPCVLTVPHLDFTPRPGIVSKRSVYESICTLDCALLEGRKLCLYLGTHGTR